MKKTVENEITVGTAPGDYLRFATINSTEKHRDKFMIGKLFINAAVCLKCHKYIRSKNVHDFVKCTCGAIAVDGGSQYQRMLGKPEDYISIIEPFAND